MKKLIQIAFMLTLTISSLGAMDGSEEAESTQITERSLTESFEGLTLSLRDDGPRTQVKWLCEAHKLVKAHKLAVDDGSLSRQSSSSFSEELLDRDQGDIKEVTFEINQGVLAKAYEIYKKAIPCPQEKQLKGPCLQAVTNNLDHKALTSSKVLAAAWLLVVSPEHKSFFKTKMLEWAIIERHKEAVKYLVRREEVDIMTPNLVGSVPLVLACEVGEENIVEILLKKGALAGEDKKVYSQAVEAATRYNRTAIVDRLEKAKNSKKSKKEEHAENLRNNKKCLIS